MMKFVAAITTATLAVGLALVGVAAPASAHYSNVSGNATCDTATGTWTVNWALSVASVPTGVESDTTVTPTVPTGSSLAGSAGVVQDGALWVAATSADSSAHPGVSVRVGNWGPVTFTQTGIPGSAPQAKVTVQSNFTDGQKVTKVGTDYFGATCTIATPKDATASVSVTPATCTAPGALVLGTTTFATWGTPSYTGSTYTAVATATGNHRFAAGTGVSSDGTTETFTGTLPPQQTEGCVSPPVADASASVTTTAPTCDAPATLVYGTTSNASFDSSSTPNGTAGPANYSVTANADAHHTFSDGTTMETFTGTLADTLPSQSTNPYKPCYVTPPVYQTPIDPLPPTFVDACGTANDTFTLPDTTGLHFSYAVSDVTVDNVRTVTITAVPDAGWKFSDSFPGTPWSHTYTNESCAPPQVVVAAPGASSCDVATTGTDLTSWVSISIADHVSWSIYPVGHPELATPLTSEFTATDAGEYTIAADADNGYILTDADQTFLDSHHEWTVQVNDTSLCQLPTDAVYDAGATGTPATCTASGTEGDGAISLLHVPSQHSVGKVQYDIQLDGSSVVQHAGSHATRVSEAPGSYTVTASAVDPINDGINGETVFHVIVAAATTACGVLTPTGGGSGLAFTGVDAGLGLALAAAMLLLGLLGLFMSRRFGRANK